MLFLHTSDSMLAMLMIRLQRVGRVHEPTFCVVVTDSKNGPKSGKFIEIIGSYDTRRDNDIKQIDVDRVKHWMSKGAQLSDTLHNYFVHKKVIEGKKVNKLPKKSPIKKEEAKEAPKTSAPVSSPASAPVAPVATPAETVAPAEAPVA